MRYRLVFVLALAMIMAACGDPEGSSPQPDLPPIDPAGLVDLMRAEAKPAVVNVWASWCVPCRSEAPLLSAAARLHGEEISFIGINVQDTQSSAKAFLDEFSLDFPHFYDPDRRIPMHFAAIGTPITFFFDATGGLIETHLGVIDDRQLATALDELLMSG